MEGDRESEAKLFPEMTKILEFAEMTKRLLFRVLFGYSFWLFR